MKHFDIIKKGIFLLLIGFICIVPFGCSEDETEVSGSIYGYVQDKDGKGLHTVNVTLSPGGKVTATGSDGRYEFNNLKPQQYAVKADKDNYRSDTKTITVIANQSVRGDITLMESNR